MSFSQQLEKVKQNKLKTIQRIKDELDKNKIPYKHKPASLINNESISVHGTKFVFYQDTVEKNGYFFKTFGSDAEYVSNCILTEIAYVVG